MNGLINLGVAGKAEHRRGFVPAILLVLCAFSFSVTSFADELVKNGGFELPVVLLII